MSDTTLLPCPLCGGGAESYDDNEGVHCSDCLFPRTDLDGQMDPKQWQSLPRQSDTRPAPPAEVWVRVSMGAGAPLVLTSEPTNSDECEAIGRCEKFLRVPVHGATQDPDMEAERLINRALGGDLGETWTPWNCMECQTEQGPHDLQYVICSECVEVMDIADCAECAKPGLWEDLHDKITDLYADLEMVVRDRDEARAELSAAVIDSAHLQQERDDARQDAAELQAQLEIAVEAQRCECSTDDVCRFAKERDEARAEVDSIRGEMGELRRRIDIVAAERVMVEAERDSAWAGIAQLEEAEALYQADIRDLRAEVKRLREGMQAIMTEMRDLEFERAGGFVDDIHALLEGDNETK